MLTATNLLIAASPSLLPACKWHGGMVRLYSFSAGCKHIAVHTKPGRRPWTLHMHKGAVQPAPWWEHRLVQWQSGQHTVSPQALKSEKQERIQSPTEVNLGSLRNRFGPCLCLIAISTKALLKKGIFFNILSNYISIQMEHELAIDSANWKLFSRIW